MPISPTFQKTLLRRLDEKATRDAQNARESSRVLTLFLEDIRGIASLVDEAFYWNEPRGCRFHFKHVSKDKIGTGASATVTMKRPGETHTIQFSYNAADGNLVLADGLAVDVQDDATRHIGIQAAGDGVYRIPASETDFVTAAMERQVIEFFTS